MEKLPIWLEHNGKKQLNSGQALLIVLLSMSVVLAVVLSSVSRSVTDISITGYEEDALRAFSAAEAGIEQALLEAVPGDTIPETIIDTTDPAEPRYEAVISDPDAGDSFEYPDKLNSGQVATFWFVSHDNAGNLVCTGETCTSTTKLEFCWTNKSNKKPAVEVAIYYDVSENSFASPNNFSGLQVKRFNFDPKGAGKNFISTGLTTCDLGSGYGFSTGTHLHSLKGKVHGCVQGGPPGCLIAARVRMLDNGSVGEDVAVGVHGGASLPSQGVLVSSTGTSGDSTREVTVLQGYPEPPDVFEGVLYSEKGIKQ